MIEIVLGGLGVTVLGALVGFLIKLGRHEQEHTVFQERFEKIEEELEKHDDRLDRNDVNFAAIMTSLDYITKQIDSLVETKEKKE